MHNTDPVFICGALRSGTTLLRLMLNQHPEIQNSGEFDFIFDFNGTDNTSLDSKRYVEWLEGNRIFKASGLKIDPELDMTGLIHSFVKQMKKENTVLALNIHRHFDKVPTLFPNARYVHVLRDPRDVALSCIGMGWAGNIYHGIDEWIETEASWDKLEIIISPYNYMVIYFEELIKNPVPSLSKLCDFLGVGYAPEMLNYANHSTYSKPDINLVNQWKKKCSIRDIQYLEAKSGYLMQKKGYELSNYPTRHPNTWDKINLWISNKKYKILFNINRYGWTLVFSDKITRWVGLKQINKKIAKKIDNIQVNFLK